MMKKTILFSLFVVFLAAAAHAVATVPDIGKYQLIQGSYMHTNSQLNTAVDIKNIFKIDTTTGDTWKLLSLTDEKGKFSEEWVRIY